MYKSNDGGMQILNQIETLSPTAFQRAVHVGKEEKKMFRMRKGNTLLKDREGEKNEKIQRKKLRKTV